MGQVFQSCILDYSLQRLSLHPGAVCSEICKIIICSKLYRCVVDKSLDELLYVDAVLFKNLDSYNIEFLLGHKYVSGSVDDIKRSNKLLQGLK